MRNTGGKGGLEQKNRYLITGTQTQGTKDENRLCQICRLAGQGKKMEMRSHLMGSIFPVMLVR